MTNKQEDRREASGEEAQDIEAFLEQKAQMERMFKDKFTKTLAVMFTDLQGSTSITETMGDLTGRMLIKQHNDIVFPCIAAHGGTLIKTIGDGTLSHFETAQHALRAAAAIQRGLDELNLTQKPPVPILVRIGIHHGPVIMEKNDVYGDVVNTAARVEAAANGGEIYLSEAACQALEDRAEVFCKFAKSATLKGKKEAMSLYKAYWNPAEIELERPSAEPARHGISPSVKLALLIIGPILAAIMFLQIGSLLSEDQTQDKREIQYEAK